MLSEDAAPYYYKNNDIRYEVGDEVDIFTLFRNHTGEIIQHRTKYIIMGATLSQVFSTAALCCILIFALIWKSLIYLINL